MKRAINARFGVAGALFAAAVVTLEGRSAERAPRQARMTFVPLAHGVGLHAQF
ncbi:MAG: hypothetical protein RLZZ450_1490 [Pseudomonadota bacterium]|jgi:hypothetical protein